MALTSRSYGCEWGGDSIRSKSGSQGKCRKIIMELGHIKNCFTRKALAVVGSRTRVHDITGTKNLFTRPDGIYTTRGTVSKFFGTSGRPYLPPNIPLNTSLRTPRTPIPHSYHSTLPPEQSSTLAPQVISKVARGRTPGDPLANSCRTHPSADPIGPVDKDVSISFREICC